MCSRKICGTRHPPALSLGNPTLPRWELNDLDTVDWRKWLVCDNSSFWRFFWALERFLHLCNSNTLCVFPSLFRFLSLLFPPFFCQGGGAEIQHLPVFISCTVTGWTALTSARGLKHAGRSEPGFFLTASVNAHSCEHTIWETALCGKEEWEKTESRNKTTSSMPPLRKDWQLASWRCRAAESWRCVRIMEQKRWTGARWRTWTAYLRTWCSAETFAGSSRSWGPGKGPLFWHVGDELLACLFVVTAG